MIDQALTDKRLRYIFVMMLVSFVLCNRPVLGAMADASDESVVTAFVQQEAKWLKGVSYGEFRDFLVETGPDAQNRFAVLYSIEAMDGGNGWLQFMVVFVKQNGKLVAGNPLRVGRKGLRLVEKMQKFQNGVITFATLNYADTDALCCPSVHGVANVSYCYGQWEESSAVINCSKK